MPAISDGRGGSPTFARVSLSAPVANWAGTTLPFDTVDYDPAKLWDATNHWFAAKSAGWYEIAAYDSGGSSGVSVPAVAGTGSRHLVAVIGGAGNNVYVSISDHTAVTDGAWIFPPLFGHTHLGVGDTIDLEGNAIAGAGATVAAGFAFSLRMVTAD